MATEQNQPKPKLPARIKVILFASLALNLVIVGVIVGAIARFGGEHGRSVHRDPMIRALSLEDRRAVGRAVREAQGGDRRALGRALGEVMDEIIAALEAEPLDRAALEAAMARKSALLRGRRDAGEAAIVETLIRMSAQERRAFARKLKEGRKRWRGKAGRRGD